METLKVLPADKTDQKHVFGEIINDDEYEERRDVKRRGSNVSLSRYRSCPQLLDDLDIAGQAQTFESTADDSIRHIAAKLSPQIAPPLIQRQFQFDQNGIPGSATPTPPSTPRSRRSFFSQSKDSPSTPVQGLSPVSTPRLLHRAFIHRPSLSRESSAESATNDNKSGVLSDPRNNHSQNPLNEENLRKHEQVTLGSPAKRVRRREGSGTGEGRNLLQSTYMNTSDVTQDSNTDSSQDKCEKWLQTLHLSKPDKIKSRSHIQLPPV